MQDIINKVNQNASSKDDFLRTVDFIDWSKLGYTGEEGLDCAIWIGTAGSRTRGHQDTYGYNVVCQVIVVGVLMFLGGNQNER